LLKRLPNTTEKYYFLGELLTDEYQYQNIFDTNMALYQLLAL